MKVSQSYCVPRRTGFTLLELLVSISIIGVLTSLLLPAVQRARESARRVQCASRLRNLGVALSNYSTAHTRYPAAGYWGGPDKTRPQPNHNWVVEILSFIDRRDLDDRWNKNVPISDPNNLALANHYLEVLICPSDPTVIGAGDLSYAVNGGIGESALIGGVHDCPVDPFFNVIDLNGNGIVCPGTGIDDGTLSDRDVLTSQGMFFTENWKFEGSPGYQGTSRYHTPASIADGMSQTIMITENIRVGVDPFVPGTNWSSPHTRRSRVYFSHRVCQSNTCAAGLVDYSRANSSNHAVNASRIQPEGEAPWPSSEHAGGVNVVFADGHLSFLDEGIDGRVYASLFSPAGKLVRQLPLDQGIIQDNDF